MVVKIVVKVLIDFQPQTSILCLRILVHNDLWHCLERDFLMIQEIWAFVERNLLVYHQ